jgi:hypothetical protein
MKHTVAHAQKKNLSVRAIREQLIRRFQDGPGNGIITRVHVDCDYLSGVLGFKFLPQETVIKFVASLCDLFYCQFMVD